MKVYADNTSLSLLAEITPIIELSNLVQKRLIDMKEIEGYELSELLHIVVVEDGDSVNDIEAQLGFTVMHNRWNGYAHDVEGFTPSWDALESHLHWYELTFVLGDDGFGVVVFLPKSKSDALTMLCDRYTKEIYKL